MKIVIPVDKDNMETDVSSNFGRAPYFLLYDLDTKESEFINNSAASSPGGAGIKAAQIIVDSEVNALLTPRCGEKAADVLKASDIKIYKTSGTSAKENIALFTKGELSLLDEIHPGFHGQVGN
ncbi:MAG: dinitrogenase iron-molybdenum cofactor biosynthesis protein [Desulfitobacterium sp.]|nr:dinitrogenase iron-molybdenum cofactor biosynthesis protein [Desulfitobacterium sp.]